MKIKRIILSFVAEAASNNAPTHQLREKAMSRMMTLLSESHQSQSVGLFMMNKVTDNISFLLAIRQHFLSAVDNCDLDLTCGDDEKRVKVMIRKLNSKDGVVSKVIYIRGLVSDDSGSNSRASSIDTRDKLRSHLLCYPDGTDMEMHVCASELELLYFLRNSSESEEELNKVILITLDENNSVVKIHDDPDKNEIKEFTKNDKKATSTSARNKTSSNKNRKRKATSTDSEKSNKAAKTAATEPEQAEEAPKTPEKTTKDTDEPPTVENTKKSSKKSKKSPKKSKAKDPNKPEKPLTDFFRWSKANRERIKEENPNLAFGDLSKEMGKQWKKVPDEEKAALKAAYQEEKKIYDEQLEKYINNKNGESDKSKNTPKTADQTTNASASTSSKKKGKRKAASAESEEANKSAKTTSTEEAVEAPKTPEKEKTPEKTSTDMDESPIVETTKKSTKKSKDPNAPKKPVHFNAQYQKSIRSEVVEENPDLSSRDINKLTAKRYKEASDEELQPFKALYDANMKIYKKDIEEYQKKKDEGNDDENDVEENSKEKNVKNDDSSDEASSHSRIDEQSSDDEDSSDKREHSQASDINMKQPSQDYFETFIDEAFTMTKRIRKAPPRFIEEQGFY